MTTIKVITDNKEREFKLGYEVPEKVRADQFAHIEDAETADGFIKYHGEWYHLDQFMVVDDRSPLKAKWDGQYCDTFFSGIAIKVSRDGETYKIGRYYC